MSANRPSRRQQLNRLTSLFTVVVATSSLLGFSALTVSANNSANSQADAHASVNGLQHGNKATDATATPGATSGLLPATNTTSGPLATPSPAPTTNTSSTSAGANTSTAGTSTAPTTGGGTTGAGAGKITTPDKTGPGDNNQGDTWLQTVGPCADHNAEVLNHNADAMSGCNLAVPGGNPEFEPPAEPTAENLQYAEIGTVESVNPDHNPHLPCANIEVMGKDMGDATGSYSIDYWPPTGDKGGVYGKNTDGSSALSLPAMINGDSDVSNNGSWKYTATPTTLSKQGKTGGYQVMDIIDVSALVHNAQLIQPDPQDIQGYHFKLQFSQDPQKHKTFWVKCDGSSPPPTPDCDGDNNGSLPTDADCQPTPDCDGDSNGSLPTDADCQTTPPQDCDGDRNGSLPTDADCQTPGGGTNPGGTGGVQGASTTTPASGVLGAATTNPFTGHPMLAASLLALALVVMGGALLAIGRVGRQAED